jgi:hypothetical protein
MTLVYLYAVAPAAAGEWLASNDVRGIEGERVRPVRTRAVVGAVSDVPAREFDQEPLDRNVADSAWLAPHAAAHQDVNAALLDGVGAVLPLAFGTIFRGESGVERVLREREGELAAALAALAGRVEWVCTLDRDLKIAAAYLARTRASGAAAGAGEGRSYLLRRKAEVESVEEQRALDREARAEFRDALTAVADELTDEPLIEGGPAARCTVLLARDGEDALRRAAMRFAARWSERGYDPRLAGPWPPYRYGARVSALRE